MNATLSCTITPSLTCRHSITGNHISLLAYDTLSNNRYRYIDIEHINWWSCIKLAFSQSLVAEVMAQGPFAFKC